MTLHLEFSSFQRFHLLLEKGHMIMATIRYKYLGGRYVMAAAITGAIVMMSFARGTAFECDVMRVVDGDTLQVKTVDSTLTVRVWGVDAPELSQPFGNSAAAFARVMLDGQIVTVKVKAKDRYGRVVGEVVMKDGRIFGNELLRAGLAWWYKEYAPRDVGKRKLEQEAMDERRGLWSGGVQVAPWEWRKRVRPKDAARAGASG
jgi:endonuclease YncB( thermonuclease family)